MLFCRFWKFTFPNLKRLLQKSCEKTTLFYFFRFSQSFYKVLLSGKILPWENFWQCNSSPLNIFCILQGGPFSLLIIISGVFTAITMFLPFAVAWKKTFYNLLTFFTGNTVGNIYSFISASKLWTAFFSCKRRLNSIAQFSITYFLCQNVKL